MKDVIHNYRVGKMVGKGGMGAVYLARHLKLERDVAVKFVAADLRDDPQFVERFLREARLMAQLDHPNIVRVFDCGEDDGVTYIVMELLQGKTLRQRIREGPISEAEAVAVVVDVLSALACAHANGVVHRDIKPANIFLCHDGAVKVMDFGIARAASEVGFTQTGAPIGTAEYMSPEQAQGKPVDARSDLYSAGVVLYELLAGHAPFTAENSLVVLNLHVVKAPPPLPASVTPALRRVVERALAKQPERRYASADEMRSALQQAVARESARKGEGTDARPDGDSDRRGAWRAALAAGGLAAVCAGAGLVWWMNGHQPEPHNPTSDPGRPAVDMSHGASQYATAQDALRMLTSDRVDDAVRLGRSLVQTNSHDAAAQAVLGNALLEKGIDGGDRAALKDGLDHVRVAASLQPDSALADVGMGSWDVTQRDYKAAVQKLREAVGRDPRSAYAQNQLGWALLQTNDLNGALAAFQNAVSIDPGIAWTKANIAEVYRRLGEPKPAEQAARECVQLYPDRGAGYLELGAALDAQGDLKGAEKAYRQGIAKDPQHAKALQSFLAMNLNKQRHMR